MVLQTTYFNDQEEHCCKHPFKNCYCNFYPKLSESLSLPQLGLKYGANTGRCILQMQSLVHIHTRK